MKGLIALSLVLVSCGSDNSDPVVPPVIDPIDPVAVTPTPEPTPIVYQTPRPAPTAAPEVVFGQVMSKAAKSVVRIDCLDAGKVVGHGTGFKLNANVIVTAAHVYYSCKSIGVWSESVPEDYVAGGSLGDAYTDTQDAEGNLIDASKFVVRTKYSGWDLIPPLAMSPTRLVVGQRVGAIGFPAGFEESVQSSQGFVTALNLPNLSPFPVLGSWLGGFSFSALSGPGNSGGPVVNEKGEVVGILVGKNTATGAMIGFDVGLLP